MNAKQPDFCLKNNIEKTYRCEARGYVQKEYAGEDVIRPFKGEIE